MYKHYILLIALWLISCKENHKKLDEDINNYEVEVDAYQPTDEELERLRIDDSINVARNTQLLEKESILKKEGNYTNRDDIVNILLKLEFMSGFKANTIELQEIVPDPNTEGDNYLKSCKYKTNTTIEFIDNESTPYLMAATSDLDTNFYYVDKVSIVKNGEEIEISLKTIAADGSLSNTTSKPFMVYKYNYYVLEFYDKSFAVQSIVDSLEVEECNEPERG